ncbi:MAG: hypothetical protein AAB726_00740 [Patescibacteria group bacterium]
MICLIYGDNKDKSIAKTAELLSVLKKKRPDAEVFEILASNWSADHFDSLLKSQGLFDKKSIIILKDVCSEQEDIRAHVSERLEDAAASENVFIFIETKLDAKFLTAIKKVSKQTIETKIGDSAQATKKSWGESSGANDFALADALGRRDSQKAWSLFQESLMRGNEPEKLHGMLFWQIKNIMLAANAKTAAEADLAPFPFSKAKTFAKNFSSEELRAFSSQLVSLYHDSRGAGRTLETEMERFLLKI